MIKKIASLASKILTDNKSSATAKKLAGSELSQTKSKNQTSAKMEEFTSSVLQSKKYNSETKSLAGSVLSQSNKKR
ncbi:hypothetical protein ES676_07455 [Bizionia saleffrena]|uniref:Uncharacterized protein n=1 Tax=Bizionia saleffrena TaxID=291189 RepID=A0A8H2LD11_9FLAO|nr:hypothetical protein ES676_07455 [Bizionia saleffrena]